MIKSITSLRFIFALMVFASHLTFLGSSEHIALQWVYQHIFSEGYIGVNFFFILSGFVLSYSYYERFQKGTHSKVNFYLARLARIYPLHLLTFILALPFSIQELSTFSKPFLVNAVANLTLTQSFVPIKSIYFSFNQLSWSISDELFFYLLFPFLIRMSSSLMNSKWHNILVGILIGAVPLFIWLIPDYLYHALFYINPIFRIFDFALGIGIFHLYQKMKTSNLTINYNLFEGLSVLVLMVFFSLHSWVPQVFRYSIYYWIPISFLILAFSFQKGLLSKALSNRKLVLCGEISFGFYMFHWLILNYFDLLNARYFNINNDCLIILIVLTGTLLTSYLSFFFFENPLKKYLTRKNQ